MLEICESVSSQPYSPCAYHHYVNRAAFDQVGEPRRLPVVRYPLGCVPQISGEVQKAGLPGVIPRLQRRTHTHTNIRARNTGHDSLHSAYYHRDNGDAPLTSREELNDVEVPGVGAAQIEERQDE